MRNFLFNHQRHGVGSTAGYYYPTGCKPYTATARAALQRKSPLSDLSNERYPFHWKRHGDADDAGAARGRNFSTPSLSNWADLNETERSFLAPTRSRTQPSRQRRGQTDECAQASPGWRRLPSDLCCRLRQHTNTTDACALPPCDRNHPIRPTARAATSQVIVAGVCSRTSPRPGPARRYRDSMPPLPAARGRHPQLCTGARYRPAALRTLRRKRILQSRITFRNKTSLGSPVERKKGKKTNGTFRQ